MATADPQPRNARTRAPRRRGPLRPAGRPSDRPTRSTRVAAAIVCGALVAVGLLIGEPAGADVSPQEVGVEHAHGSTPNMYCNVAFWHNDGHWANVLPLDEGDEVRVACQFDWTTPALHDDVDDALNSLQVYVNLSSGSQTALANTGASGNSAAQTVTRTTGAPGRLRARYRLFSSSFFAGGLTADATPLGNGGSPNVCVSLGFALQGGVSGGNRSATTASCAFVDRETMIAIGGRVPMPGDYFTGAGHGPEPGPPTCTVHAARMVNERTGDVVVERLANGTYTIGSSSGADWGDLLGERFDIQVQVSGLAYRYAWGYRLWEADAGLEKFEMAGELFTWLEPRWVTIAPEQYVPGAPDEVLHSLGAGCRTFIPGSQFRPWSCIDLIYPEGALLKPTFCDNWGAENGGGETEEWGPGESPPGPRELGRCLARIFDGVVEVDLTDPGSWLNFVGDVLNPLNYALATVCVFQWAFIPQERMTTYRNQLGNAADGTVLDGGVQLANMSADVVGAVATAANSPGCTGTLNLGFATFSISTVCSISGYAILKVGLGVVVAFGCIIVLWRLAASIFNGGG